MTENAEQNQLGPRWPPRTRQTNPIPAFWGWERGLVRVGIAGTDLGAYTGAMYTKLGLGLLWYAVLVVSMTFHEAAHALAAWKMGDPTAGEAGLVTLDPLPHIQRSPMGMVVIPIITFVMSGFTWMIGWASAPYDPYWARRYPKKAVVMALAGPGANLLLVVVAGVLIRIGMLMGIFAAPESIDMQTVTMATGEGLANGAAVGVSILFSLNLILLVFNLLPLPPLDGSEIVTLFLSESAIERYRAAMAQPGFQIMGLIVAWHAIEFVIGPVRIVALNLLYPGAGYH